MNISYRPVGWRLSLPIERRSGISLLRQISLGLRTAIRTGELTAGERLPSSRRMADELSVHRNTVLEVYRDLQAEGWLETRAGSGTYVSSSMPDVAPRPFTHRRAARLDSASRVAPRPGYSLPPRTRSTDTTISPSVMNFSGGLPDLRLLSGAALARAYRRALRRQPSLLGYGDPAGHPRLCAALASNLSSNRGVRAEPQNILVTRGSQMALHVLAASLFRPGDRVIVESYGYRPAWQAFRAHGAKLVPARVDAQGISVTAVQRLLERGRVRALYLTPHHQFPTTVTLSAGRRLALLELCAEHRVAIIEDDYDHEFHYDGQPVMPLISADPHGVVAYIGTLSKIFAPGVRVGYLVAPPALIDCAAQVRRLQDRQGDQVVEYAIAEMLEEGEIGAHARRVRRTYRQRRDALVEQLHHHFADEVEFRVPPGGMAIWTRWPNVTDIDGWIERALAAGVALRGGRFFRFDGRARPQLRLAFAAHTREELARAVAILSDTRE